MREARRRRERASYGHGGVGPRNAATAPVGLTIQQKEVFLSSSRKAELHVRGEGGGYRGEYSVESGSEIAHPGDGTKTD